MNFITPLAPETAAVRALIPRVLRRGCAAYPSIAQLTERMQTLYNTVLSGSAVYRRGEMQIISQGVSMLDNSVIPDGTDVWSGALSLLRDVWFAPLLENGVFYSSYVEREKESLCDAIRASINNKSAYAATRCYQEMCKDERFSVSVLGTAERVSTATADAVYAEYQNILRRMPCEIYYVGRGSASALASHLRDAFDGVERDVISLPPTEKIRTAGTVREVTETQPTAQSKLSLGFRTDSFESEGARAAMLMFQEIYGSGPLSKLFMNVREKLSLCYYCSSSAELLKGVMQVNCGIEAAKKDAAQAEILAQLDCVRNGDFTAAEMEAARKSLHCAITQIGDEPDAMASWALGRQLAGQNITRAEELAQIDAVTKSDIIEIARKITLDTVYFMRGAENSDTTEESDDSEE